MGVFRAIFDAIIEFLKSCWKMIKKIFVTIIDFTKNIYEWAKKKIEKYKNDKAKKTISQILKKNLDTGNYEEINIGLFDNLEKVNSKTKNNEEIIVVNTIFDTDIGEIVNYEEDMEIIESSNGIDKQALSKFRNKSMIVYN